VRVAARAHHFGEVVLIAEVGPGLDGVFGNGRPEAGPVGPGIELLLGLEQRCPATNTVIHAGDLGIVFSVRETLFGLPLPRKMDVRFGSLAEVRKADPDVRFTPESGH